MSDIESGLELGRIAGIWNMLGKRWTLQILKSMGSREATRFSELKRSLAGISGTVLSERLLELEREGLVTKKIYGAVPPRVEYRLTASAKELEKFTGRIWQVVCRPPFNVSCDELAAISRII